MNNNKLINKYDKLNGIRVVFKKVSKPNGINFDDSLPILADLIVEYLKSEEQKHALMRIDEK